MPAAVRPSPWSKLARAGRLALPLVLGVILLATSAAAGQAQTGGRVVLVGYKTPAALRGALDASGGRLLRQLPQIRVAVVQVPAAGGTATLRGSAGIGYVADPVERRQLAEPALAPAAVPGGAYEWQYAATHLDQLSAADLAAAAPITIAVIDSGADMTAPDLAAKSPAAWSVLYGSTDVSDVVGHGTFVSSLAAGSPTNGEGIAGFGGSARLLVIQAGGLYLDDVDIAAAITYAVDHGAKIINMSFGGGFRSLTEERALAYAINHGVLLVAAAGNDGAETPEFPAAELQPLASNGAGGTGLAVAATDVNGARASFSNFGSYISLAAPGKDVFGAIATGSGWTTTPLPGSSQGLYGYSSGTSFSAPEVAGIAALVWGADPSLQASDVAGILKETASGHGAWTPQLGFGIVNAQAAVAKAAAHQPLAPPVTLTGTRSGTHVALSWSAPRAVSYRLKVSKDGARARVLFASTLNTSAAYDLEPGHDYSFTAETNDLYGYHGVSQPYTVSLPLASTSLSLVPSTRQQGHRLLVHVSLTLRAGDPTVATKGRRLVLESFDGSDWRVFDRVTSSAGGRAETSFTLRPGSYRIRACFAGSDDLRAATSSTLSLRVR